jgi:hypothetical protein
MCEELNTVYREKCYFATAMLTRGVLDHVPPIFGKKGSMLCSKIFQSSRQRLFLSLTLGWAAHPGTA